MNLNTDQLQTLDEGQPVSLIVEGRDCVLMNSQTYAQLRDAVDDWHPSTMQRQMAEMMADDWNDPVMSVYDE